MKRTISLLVIAVVTTGIQAQSVTAWQLHSVPFDGRTGDDVLMYDQPSSSPPVGIEFTSGTDLVLLTGSAQANSSSWKVSVYDDWNTLENDLQAEIDDGFAPADIARTGDVIAVLWTRTDLEIESWRLHAARHDDADRRRTVRNYGGQGFALWGFSIHESLAWYLFVRVSERTYASAVFAFDPGSRTDLEQATSSIIEQGWQLHSLAIDNSMVYLGCVR